MKKLKNLKDAKALNKKEQQTINGGNGPSNPFECQQVCGTWFPAFNKCLHRTCGCC